MRNKNILITGGAGFIGSHLCEKLLRKENTVVCIDSLSTGNKNNIEPFLSNSNFHFIQEDIRNITANYQLPIAKFNQIYDLASPASVTYITDNPIETATVNAIGLKNLLDIAKKHSAKFLFASSSEVYGDPLKHPQKESYWGNVNPIGVRSGYDEGKRFGEALCMGYYREHGLKIRIARIFNTYGPNSNAHDSRVIPCFVTRAIQGKPLTVHGDGNQTRSFCYISDLVSGLIALMESSLSTPVNLGNPDEYSILKIAQLIKRLANSSSKIEFAARPKNDPSRRKPDISLAKLRLKWEPKVSLKKGIIKTIDYFIGKNGK